MSNSLLVTIEKGTQQLRVHVDALEQHLRLGWKKVEDEAEKLVEKVDAELKDGTAEIEKVVQNAEGIVKSVGRREKAGATAPQA